MNLQTNPTNTSCPFWSILVHFILLLSVSLSQPTTASFSSASGNETDEIALLKFKESISDDPLGVLGSWNGSAHFCSWRGISCSVRHQRVATISLDGYNLRGTISPYIGNLSFIRSIELGANRLFGGIPQQVSHLFRLQHLNLSYNMLEGKIPANLSYCPKLVSLSLGSNNLTGDIPSELGSLAKLVQLSLAQNNLSGEIPPSLGNISTLKTISVAYNNLEGTIPDELGRLKSLIFFGIGENNLFGEIPLSLYNISSLNIFSVAANRFNGTLPPNIGLQLPNLQGFGIGDNEFSGEIPESFSNASQLQVLDIGKNYFSGQVPTSFGNLPSIWKIALGKNKLGNYSAHSLDFIAALSNCSKLEILDLSYNNFGGDLPNSVANLSTRLTKLFLGVNQISGNIPATLGNLVNLILLSMWGNLFSGVIPDTLGKLQNLQVLYLDTNKLSGKIPSSIGNFTQISELYLSRNRLEGIIPPSIVNCQSLQDLQVSSTYLSGDIPEVVFSIFSLVIVDLSRNSFGGSLPVEVSKLKNVNILDLSENNISSEIPTTIGDCQSLEFLYLQGNFFRGTLSPSLASLRGLQYLDLSRNNLSGQIPKDLGKLRFLKYLNLSYNNLEGEVPQEGVFRNTSAISIAGNTNLCGGEPKLQLPRCLISRSKQGMSHGLKLTIAVASAVAVFFLVSVFAILYWRRKSQRKSSSATTTIGHLSKVEYKRLYHATNGFSPSMLIGTGSFGSVYKGILDQEENLVAVKVLNLHKKGADKSFIAECNALRNARHRNLIKVLTCCSSMDYNGNEFKALVFEYMPNGSLDEWLHPVTADEHQSRGLNLTQRLHIAIDVAFALQYLHDHCDPHIIHCDLKPANVLLDNDLVAHVSDFGLARLISNTSGFSESQTSTTGIKGTIGYAAPEYAMGGEPSKQGDVYSYGILVLEMFTGRRPTDEMFENGFNLRSFVKTALPERVAQIVDSTLLLADVEETETTFGESGSVAVTAEEKNIRVESANQQSTSLQKRLVSVLEIGFSCSVDAPKERMNNMVDVIRELENIVNAHMDVGIQGHGQRTS